jgi:hypothetical protein
MFADSSSLLAFINIRVNCMDINENISLYTPKSELWIRVGRKCWWKSSQCRDPDYGFVLIAPKLAWSQSAKRSVWEWLADNLAVYRSHKLWLRRLYLDTSLIQRVCS